MIDDGEGITIIDITYPILCVRMQVSFYNRKAIPQICNQNHVVIYDYYFKQLQQLDYELKAIRNETPGPKHSTV